MGTGLKLDLKWSGPDFASAGTLAMGPPFGGTFVGINYFQTVSENLALGRTYCISRWRWRWLSLLLLQPE